MATELEHSRSVSTFQRKIHGSAHKSINNYIVGLKTNFGNFVVKNLPKTGRPAILNEDAQLDVQCENNLVEALLWTTILQF
jgi:hypothetical protein